jgi:hypothetical protein
MEGDSAGASGKMLNHLALHYRPGDSDQVVRLFTTMGLTVEDLGPARNGDRLLKVYIQSPREDGFFFVTSATKAQLDFEAGLMRACSTALATYNERRQSDPESSFHIAVRYESLEALERAVAGLQAAAADPELAGRLTVIPMKARKGDVPAIAERMTSSPVFRSVARESFDPAIVQVFVQTDLVAGGLLAVGQTFELDYIFLDRVAPYVPVRVYEGLG